MKVNPLVPTLFLERQLFFSKFWRRIEGGKLEALSVHNVTVQLASHLDMLYSIEFSFMCIWNIYSEVILIEFFKNSYCPRQGIFQTFCKVLLNPFSYALCE